MSERLVKQGRALVRVDAPDPPPPPAHAERNPFAYCHPTPDELAPFLGRNWVIARRSPAIKRRYGEDVQCITPLRYDTAVAAAIEARGWARPAERIIRDLLRVVHPYGVAERDMRPEVVAALEILKHARKP